MSLPRIIPVATCGKCPHKQRHYSQDECSAFNFQALPEQKPQNGIMPAIPDWCPLPVHPSFLAAAQAGSPQGGAA